MEQVVRDYEQAKIKDEKKEFVDAQKVLNQEQIQSLSKTKQKKFENSALQNYSQINSTLGLSLSIDNAIMYMQNVISSIEYKVQNEIRYSINFKSIAKGQIARLDLTQQMFYEELKQSAQGLSDEQISAQLEEETGKKGELKKTIISSLKK